MSETLTIKDTPPTVRELLWIMAAGGDEVGYRKLDAMARLAASRSGQDAERVLDMTDVAFRELFDRVMPGLHRQVGLAANQARLRELFRQAAAARDEDKEEGE